MSATNSTANYELPIFLATDKPAWLTDWNGAMSAIDTAIHTAQAAADGAQTTASAATADISTINASLTTITGNITSLTTSVNSNTGAINTINSLIGNGEPTTTDKTLIGAINEIYGMITGGSNPIEADDVAYDNTTSGLTATDVQAAIDEVYAAIPVGPTPVEFDFDLSAQTAFTIAVSTGVTLVAAVSEVDLLLNTAKNIGKIYGGLSCTIASNTLSNSDWTTVATLSSVDMPVTNTPYNIHIANIPLFSTSGNTFDQFAASRLSMKADGTVDVQLKTATAQTAQVAANIDLPPCIYFMKDLDD